MDETGEIRGVRGIFDKLRHPIEQRQLEKSIQQLRLRVHAEQIRALKDRQATTPEYTEEEKRLGVYLEEIEPQVRNAVLEFNRKGYATSSSGFWGRNGEWQVIEGDFRLEDDTAVALKAAGVTVTIEPSWKLRASKLGGEEINPPEDAKYTTDIRFRPRNANLLQMEQKWNQIAAMLPDRGYHAVNWYKENRQ